MLSTFCLALVVYTEARGEPYDGQLMVAEVVMNRVKMKEYPNNICDVAFDYKQFSGLNSEIDLSAVVSDDAWERSIDVAYAALSGETLGTDATHYHNHTVDPYWVVSMAKLGVVGNHTFYKKLKETKYEN
jgi:spore germination cell wall hydrolase CwlJ-like protein